VIVLRVLPFVLAASLRNRVRHQLRRLRQPKYALATAVGLAWFWLYAGRHLFAGPRGVPTLPASVTPALTPALAAGGTALLLLAWIFRARHQALAMSEAEVQFLFPAPLSRVDVLHYRVLQLLAYGLVGTVLTTLLFGRAASGSPLLFALGAWIAFGTADLHRLGIALTWAAVGEGWSGVRRRAGTFALLAAAIAFTAWAATHVEVPPLRPSAEWFGELARAVLDSPLRWPLWPGMALAGLALSRTAAEFAAHLPGALAVLAVHYVWVVRSGVAFEEAVVHASERRARAREAFLRRRGGLPERRGPRRPPFRLGATGRAEVAFVWKGLIATGWAKLAGRRGAALAVALAALVGWLASPAGDAALAALGPIALVAWSAVTLVGPSAVRADLRLDRQSLDLLRALPVSGAEVVRGEILGAAAPLVALQTMLLPVAAMGLRGAGGPGAALWLAAGAAALGPALSLVHLVLQNTVVVLLPGWVPKDGERGGPETVGLRLLVAIGGLVALSLLVLPAAAVAGLVAAVWWALAGALSPPAIALAAWIAAAVLLAETWLATRILGSAFDRLDPSDG
jgi:hypothetical protein